VVDNFFFIQSNADSIMEVRFSKSMVVVTCIFLRCTYFFKDIKYQKYFLNIFLISLVVIAVISTIKHATYGFDFKLSYLACQPFYRDHTIYGAALSLMIPIAFFKYLILKINLIIK